MAKTDFESVDEYLATLPAAVRAILRRVRSTIRKAVPAAEEVISYQIPAYKLVGGGAFLYFAGWKEHYALYPANGPLVDAFKAERTSLGSIRILSRRQARAGVSGPQAPTEDRASGPDVS